MKTLEISVDAMESIKRMTQKLTDDNKILLDALKGALMPLELYHAYGWPDRAGVIRQVKQAIAKIEAKPEVMEGNV